MSGALGLAMICLAAGGAPFEPTPAWVTLEQTPAAEGAADGATRVLLDETQVRVTPKLTHSYYRTVSQVLNAEGIDSAAHYTIDFDPSYERVAFHALRITRDGVTRDAWKQADVRVIDRESQLEQRIYDGRRSIVLEAHDVRVGDVVELAWSSSGTSPLFGDRFYADFPTAHPSSVDRLVVRLVWEKSTQPAIRQHEGAPAFVVTSRGPVVEYAVKLDHVPAFVREERLPRDVRNWPSLEISEWSSWSEVAKRAAALFAVSGPSPLVEAELKRLRALPEGEPRLREAIRFVQDDLRYLSVSLGTSSHQPHPPQWVLERRFGDCKDKALLTTALLEGLGVDAVPALVNTRVGARIDAWLPNPFAFDHAIVRAVIGGKEVWIDATVSMQRGALDERPPPPFRRALVLSPRTTGLTTIPLEAPKTPTWELEQRWDVPDHSGLATLTVTTTARADQADMLRRALAGVERAETTRNLLALRKESDDVDLSAERDVEWTDDPEKNVLVRVEHYRVRKFFDAEYRHDFFARAVDNELERPPPGERAAPLAVSHPSHVHERIVFNAPQTLSITVHPQKIDLPAYHYEFSGSGLGSRLELDYDLVTKKDRVEPAELVTHAQGVRRIFDDLGYWVKLPPGSGSSSPSASSTPDHGGGLWVCPGLAVLLAVLSYVRSRGQARDEDGEGGPTWRQRRRKKSFAALFRVAAAETPASAVTLASLEAGEKRFRSKCPRGHAWSGPSVNDGAVLLGGESITVLKRTCAQCGAEERRYFRLLS